MLRVLRLVVATLVAVATLGLAGAPAGADGTGAVTGTLFDQSDAPLVGGTVGLLRDCGASCEETVTDASGQYLFEGLTPGSDYCVAVNGPTDPEFCFQAIDGTFTVPDIQVGPTAPGVLRGTVTAAGGAPLDGASVVVGGRVATTDGSGQYQVTGLPPQEYDVTVGHTGCQARVVPVTVVGGYAKDDFGVLKVRVAVRDQDTDTWLQPDGSWGAYRPLRAYSTDPGARRTVWKFKRTLAPGSYGISLIVVDTVLQRNPPPRPWLVVTVQP